MTWKEYQENPKLDWLWERQTCLDYARATLKQALLLGYTHLAEGLRHTVLDLEAARDSDRPCVCCGLKRGSNPNRCTICSEALDREGL